ncbi:MAG: type II secretion system protein [bacterium]
MRKLFFRNRQKGMSLIELMILTSVIGIMFVSGARVFFRQLNAGSDIITYSQAVNLANQLMELRRCTGRFPNRRELQKYTPVIKKSKKLDFSVSEENYKSTDLKKVTVEIKWRPSRGKERKIKLVSLMEE